ncbi:MULTISPECIES: dienelactone hydrolase family protein [unclassified Pseudohongiella]|uniref:dienelactone hydrolase family protein n=1 Tax=unclassified Pseudohongiella TaxID=2629611 RepID=UPI002698AB21|nr:MULTISPECIES: dienelactone hydrolase family protein [unclassified Pseudohongiella]MEC8860354.1 dienelactone hydrolase family protein [Pseudomonadota bacterium]|tara:strand:- start:5562 stop:6311 length:750 start_codon:yes stop_codon:yes gene_type:complete
MLKTEYIEYQDGDVVLEAYVAYDEDAKEPRPCVLVAHDWTGRRAYACAGAERMAELGYVGFAVDVYGKGKFGKEGDVEGNSALMKPFVEDRALLRGRMLAALAAARKLSQVDDSNMGAMGYCFGGMSVLELARSGADVKGVASVHGLLFAGEAPSSKAIQSKVLVLHGHDDPMVPPEQVLAFEQEMSDAGVDWQVHVYGGTKHAFTNPGANNPDFGTVYSQTANRRAEQALANFFHELFVDTPPLDVAP